MIVSMHSNQNQTSWTYPRPCTTSLKQDRLVIRPFFMSEVTNEQASRLRLLVIMFAPINLVETCPTTLTAKCSSWPSMAITDLLVLKPVQGDCLPHALPR